MFLKFHVRSHSIYDDTVYYEDDFHFIEFHNFEELCNRLSDLMDAHQAFYDDIEWSDKFENGKIGFYIEMEEK